MGPKFPDHQHWISFCAKARDGADQTQDPGTLDCTVPPKKKAREMIEGADWPVSCIWGHILSLWPSARHFLTKRQIKTNKRQKRSFPSRSSSSSRDRRRRKRHFSAFKYTKQQLDRISEVSSFESHVDSCVILGFPRSFMDQVLVGCTRQGTRRLQKSTS